MKIKRFLLSKTVAKLIIMPLLRLHSFAYKYSGVYSVILNEGSHPKHGIIRYFDWFNNNINKQDVVVDIGCNKGYMVNYLSNKAKYVYGIEIISEFIEYANDNYTRDNIMFINEDATKFNFKSLNHNISIVTLSNVLEHIDNRVDFLKKIKSNIQSNIKFLIRVPMINREWIVIYKKNMGLEYRLDKTHFIEYTIEKFKDEIEEAGLKILNHEIKWGEIYAICE